MLKELLDNEMKKRGLSLRATAKQIDVAHTTIQRVLNGDSADVDTITKICDWLGVSVSTALDVVQKNSDENVEKSIALIIQSKPALRDLFERAINDVKAGVLTTDDLADILSYAAFRLDLARKNAESKSK